MQEVLRISFVALRFQADEEERTSLRGFSSPLLEHCVPEGVLPFDVSLTSNLPLSEQDRQLSNARHTVALKTNSSLFFSVLHYTTQLVSYFASLSMCRSSNAPTMTQQASSPKYDTILLMVLVFANVSLVNGNVFYSGLCENSFVL